jgi:hypothetical protein
MTRPRMRPSAYRPILRGSKPFIGERFIEEQAAIAWLRIVLLPGRSQPHADLFILVYVRIKRSPALGFIFITILTCIGWASFRWCPSHRAASRARAEPARPRTRAGSRLPTRRRVRSLPRAGGGA